MDKEYSEDYLNYTDTTDEEEREHRKGARLTITVKKSNKKLRQAIKEFNNPERY